MKDVEIHFPNTQIRLERVSDEDAKHWETMFSMGKTFLVEYTAPYSAFKPKPVRYVVNGELVTYMFTKEHQEGF
jgi:hypothetical protein